MTWPPTSLGSLMPLSPCRPCTQSSLCPGHPLPWPSASLDPPRPLGLHVSASSSGKPCPMTLQRLYPAGFFLSSTHLITPCSWPVILLSSCKPHLDRGPACLFTKRGTIPAPFFALLQRLKNSNTWCQVWPRRCDSRSQEGFPLPLTLHLLPPVP